MHPFLKIAAVGAVMVLFAAWLTPYDDSDSAKGRSGMAIHTDNLTGCQYLSRNGITPRLAAGGKHLGCKD